MTYEQKDRLRINLGMILIIVIAIMAYIVIPFLWIYIIAIITSVIAMIEDWYTAGIKQGLLIDVLKWTTLIPVVNLIPLLIIPVFGFVNLFFKED